MKAQAGHDVTPLPPAWRLVRAWQKRFGRRAIVGRDMGRPHQALRRSAESSGGSYLKLLGGSVMRPHSIVRRAVFPVLLTLASCTPAAPPLAHIRVIAHDYAFEFPATIRLAAPLSAL